jgi:hypothetical protein
MGLWPTPGNENRRRPRESGDPLSVQWIPAFAGMTQERDFQDLRSLLKMQLPRFFASLRKTVLKGFSAAS